MTTKPRPNVSPLKVTICYGFLEGDRIGRSLRRLLEANGYTYVSEPAAADIVIAHSAACLQLSETLPARLIFLIGAPLPVNDRPIVFIANKDDPWYRSTALPTYIDKADAWAFVSLPGNHDTIWEDPVMYKDIVTHYANLLA